MAGEGWAGTAPSISTAWCLPRAPAGHPTALGHFCPQLCVRSNGRGAQSHQPTPTHTPASLSCEGKDAHSLRFFKIHSQDPHKHLVHSQASHHPEEIESSPRRDTEGEVGGTQCVRPQATEGQLPTTQQCGRLNDWEPPSLSVRFSGSSITEPR